MKLQALLIGLVLILFAAPVSADNVNVMMHLCNSNVQSGQQFDALGSFLSKEEACPPIVLPADANGTASANFDVIVNNQHINDADFQTAQICNENNATCMNESHYAYTADRGNVTVRVVPPANARFGAVEFTPDSIMQNNDDATFVSLNGNVIMLNTSKDNDSSVMLHIFNFINENTTNTTTTTNTTVNTTTQTNTTTVSDTSAYITVKDWYPQMGAYVFECNTPGMAPTSYDWYFGDGEKLLGIGNQNVFHTYTQNGNYQVACVAHEGNTVANASLSVSINDVPFKNACSPLQNLPATCSGGTITQQDLGKSCRTIICDGNGNSMTVLACDKPSAVNPLYFEMYKKSETGGNLEICLGSTCIGSSNFARSPVMACTESDRETVSDNTTNTTNTTTSTNTTVNTTNTTNTTLNTTDMVNITGNVTNSTAHGQMVLLCHKAGDGSRHTLRVNEAAKRAHLAHGDTLGACSTLNTTNVTNVTNSTNMSG